MATKIMKKMEAEYSSGERREKETKVKIKKSLETVNLFVSCRSLPPLLYKSFTLDFAYE